MAAYVPGGDEGDHDLAALFSGSDNHSGGGGEAWSVDAMYGNAPGELDDSATAWMVEESHETVMYGDAPAEFADSPTDLTVIHESPPADLAEKPTNDGGVKPFTVANPAGTVWVSAGIGGMTLRVDLSPTVVGMTEAKLAEEVRVLADLARLKGQAGQLALLLDAGVADADADDGDLPTLEQAAAAQAAVFAARYGGDA
ncbi:MAG: hypothetical protein WCI78_10240 [Mycobacterium sp.]